MKNKIAIFVGIVMIIVALIVIKEATNIWPFSSGQGQLMSTSSRSASFCPSGSYVCGTVCCTNNQVCYPWENRCVTVSSISSSTWNVPTSACSSSSNCRQGFITGTCDPVTCKQNYNTGMCKPGSTVCAVASVTCINLKECNFSSSSSSPHYTFGSSETSFSSSL